MAAPTEFACRVTTRMIWLAFLDTVPATMTSSMHHDLEKGNRLEVAWLSGGVVELGRAVNVATPANRAVWDILALHAGGRMN